MVKKINSKYFSKYYFLNEMNILELKNTIEIKKFNNKWTK